LDNITRFAVKIDETLVISINDAREYSSPHRQF
jgi:hypothetical protein